MTVPQRMHAGVNAGFLQTTHDHLGYRIRLEVGAIRFCENQVVILVVLSEMALVLGLLVTVELKRDDGTLPQAEVSRLFALGGLHSKTGGCLLKRFSDEERSCPPVDIRPLNRQ